MDRYSFFIPLIELGLEKGDDGTSVEEAKEYLKHKNLLTNEQNLEPFYLVFADFFEIGEIFYQHLQKQATKKFFLRTDTYFRYLEYIELQEARKTSMEAKCLAIVAIVISALSMLLPLITKQDVMISQVAKEVLEQIVDIITTKK